MADLKPCKHGCGKSVSLDATECPNCGGTNPHPDRQETAKAGVVERGCLVVMLLGGLLTAVLLLLTKLLVD